MPARFPVVTEVHSRVLFASGFLHFTFGVEEVHRGKALDAVAHDHKLAPPDCLAAAAAVFRALPEDSHSAAKIGRCEWSLRLNDLGAVEHVHAIQWRCAKHLDRKFHGHRLRYG